MKENSNVKHLVMFSGGASSAYVAKWVVDKYGRDDVILFFTDTQWEDEDNYRFMEEAASYIGVEITRVVDGRTPEDVFFENRFLGNARHAQCSEELKVKQTLLFIEGMRLRGEEPIIYFGIGPNEPHRAESLRFHYTHLPLDPVEVRFPMIDSMSTDIKARFIIENEWGIKLPRMYHLGFHHANCGGRCVRAGMHHFANLYLVWPDRYAEFESMEERFRDKFELDVAMMKREGSPYTLKTFRQEVIEKMSPEELHAYAKEKDVETIPCFCSFS
jgi:3'-phosphoadenosine 5'-phosphosulfate sulfotransferase (PAPS reductase)/FAD synthetase